MQALKQRIIKDGKIAGPGIVKVDSFLNHQIDWKLMEAIGAEFKERVKVLKIDKVLTIEASGIVIGVIVARLLDVPLVFAKKQKPITQSSTYQTTVHSFTKQTEYTVSVSKEYLKQGEKIFVVDDFLAQGNAAVGLIDLVQQAGASTQAVGIVIEKTFQPGRKLLEERGIRVESLARISKIDNNCIEFLEDK
jgi:xanthine phosphoribosyltransferase